MAIAITDLALFERGLEEWLILRSVMHWLFGVIVQYLSISSL